MQWRTPALNIAAAALEGYLYCTYVRHGGTLAGLGRVTGDGNFNYNVQEWRPKEPRASMNNLTPPYALRKRTACNDCRNFSGIDKDWG